MAKFQNQAGQTENKLPQQSFLTLHIFSEPGIKFAKFDGEILSSYERIKFVQNLCTDENLFISNGHNSWL
jgi:hypothetical protein